MEGNPGNGPIIFFSSLEDSGMNPGFPSVKICLSFVSYIYLGAAYFSFFYFKTYSNSLIQIRETLVALDQLKGMQCRKT
jgi:hypothetical protein